MIERIIEGSLRLRGLVLLALLGVTGYGIFAYREMPVDAFPDISPIMVPVFVEGHGLAPEEMERLVTYPIESAMNGLPGVTQIKSTSAFGMAVIYVYFRDNVDMYFARQLVSERLASVTNDLPKMDEPPALGPISTGLGQVFIYYLTMDDGVDTGGKDPLTYLREVNDWIIKPQLRMTPGVADILSIGGHILQYQIRVNPKALLEYGLSMEDIAEAVQKNNHNVSGQFLVLGVEESLVRGIGLIKDIGDIANIPVKVVNGVAVTIGSVAEVAYGSETRRGVVTLNGKQEAVSGLVLKLFGENTSRVITLLNQKTAEVQASLPQGVHIVPYYEQADLVEKATWTVKSALLQGGALVLIVLLLFLGNFHSAVIVGLSLPLCALIAIILMRFTNLSANLMSLGGIAIAIGMLGDGATVMVENIFRRLGDARDPGGKDSPVLRESALEVGRPIVFSVAIIVAVFLPIFTLEGVEGKMFTPLAMTIAYALLGSLVVAVVVAPALSSFWLSGGNIRESRWLNALKALYRPTLRAAIRLRVLVLFLSLAGVGGALALLPRLGTEFIPTLEEGSILIGVAMTPSISIEKATETVMKLEQRICEHPEVERTVSRIGRPETGSHPHPVNYAEIHIDLKEGNDETIRRVKGTLIKSLSHELAAMPGVQLNFTQPIQNAFDELLSGTKAQLAIKLYGDNLTQLQGKAEEIQAAIKGVPGLVDISSEQSFGQSQVQIEADRAACARYGLSVADVMEVIELAVGGEVIDTLYQNTRRFGIHLRLQEEARKDPEAIRKLLLKAPSGSVVELGQVASVREVTGPIQINREHGQRRWTVQANIRGRDLGGAVAEARSRIEQSVKLPPGYFVEYGGQFENQQRAMARLSLVAPVVIAVVYVLLWLSFSSMRDALMVMLSVPLALIGGILGLFWTGEYLSVPASVGFIALFGIAVQNGVVLVSCMRQQGESGGKLTRENLIEAACLRLRPVLMTALTTVLGLLPLLFSAGIGSEVQRPLAVVVVFGLTTSTLLTLYVLPAVYSWTASRK